MLPQLQARHLVVFGRLRNPPLQHRTQSILFVIAHPAWMAKYHREVRDIAAGVRFQ
ncbi:MAG: hypothetical protein WBY53_05055 [Acidobacteriaceae bacterium]